LYMLLMRFLAVGVLNTIFGYAIYGLCIYIGMNFGVALLIATLIGIVFNFCTNKTIVFRSKKKSIFLQFVMVYVFIYAVNYTGIKLLTQADQNPYVAALIMLPFATILSYLLNKKVVFNNEKKN
jgi:putative flippase GtrA